MMSEASKKKYRIREISFDASQAIERIIFEGYAEVTAEELATFCGEFQVEQQRIWDEAREHREKTGRVR